MQHRIASADDALLQHQLHDLLRRRGHIFEALTKWHDREARALAVEVNLADIELFTPPFDELLNVAIVDHVVLFGHGIALVSQGIVGDMAALDAQVQRVLRHPEVREQDILVVLVAWQEHQHEGRDVDGGR